MKLLIICIAFITSLSFSYGQTAKISWLEGNWKGEGYQPLSTGQKNWTIDLKYSTAENTYIISYPTFPCGGYWEMVKSDDQSAEFIERITNGTDKCANNLKVVVERKGKKKIKVSFIQPESGFVDATGVLKRR